MPNFSSPWRQAGLNYLQYLSIASKAVRSVLKEPAKSKALERSAFSYNRSVGQGGKVPVKDLKTVTPAAK